MPSMPQEGVLCGTFGLSLPAVEVDEAFWHWGEDQRERGLHAWLAPLSFKHCTPLHLAAFYGHTSVVNVLLASNACEPNARNAQVTSPHPCSQKLASWRWCRHGRIYLQRCQALALVAQSSPGHRACISCWNGSGSYLTLVDDMACWHWCYSAAWPDVHAVLQGCTALHMAAHQGHAETATRLCKADGCDMDAGDGMGRTALHHAAALGHDAVVQELWGKGCSVQAVDIDGWTGMHPLPPWLQSLQVVCDCLSSAVLDWYATAGPNDCSPTAAWLKDNRHVCLHLHLLVAYGDLGFLRALSRQRAPAAHKAFVLGH